MFDCDEIYKLQKAQMLACGLDPEMKNLPKVFYFDESGNDGSVNTCGGNLNLNDASTYFVLGGVAADDGITQLRHEADGTIVIPNGQLISRHTDVQHQSFEASDLALVAVVRSLSDAATSFNTYSVFEKSITGYPILLFGIGRAEGHKSAKQAAKLALTSPFLDDSLDGIQRILIIVTGRVTDEEKDTVKHIVKKAVGSSVHVKCKQMFDDSLGKEIQVAILASQK